MKISTLIIIVVIVLLAFGGYALLKNKQAAQSETNTAVSTADTAAADTSAGDINPDAFAPSGLDDLAAP